LLVDLGFDTLGTYGIKAKVAIEEYSEVQCCGAGYRVLLWMEGASYTPRTLSLSIIAPQIDKDPSVCSLYRFVMPSSLDRPVCKNLEAEMRLVSSSKPECSYQVSELIGLFLATSQLGRRV
jgi:hypothetical protein